MPPYPLPTLTAIQCFEAAARHLSFTRAAEELNLTQSAVSKQVAKLEAILERCLFSRVRKRLQLTPEGVVYLAEARSLLSQAAMSTRKMRSFTTGRQELRVSTLPTLGSRWLIPCLNGFRFAHPGIDLNIQNRLDLFDFDKEGIDIAFFFGHGTWPNAKCIYLLSDTVIPVCSPDTLGKTALKTPLDLTQFVLLHTSSRLQAWHNWFETQGKHTSHSYHGPKFDTFGMSIEAARTGCGVALVPDLFAHRELQNGELIIPWDFTLHSDGAYYMAIPEHKVEVESVKCFVDWIQTQLAASPRQFPDALARPHCGSLMAN